VKEFKSAGEDDKQEVYAKIEEEASNLNGSLERLILFIFIFMVLCFVTQYKTFTEQNRLYCLSLLLGLRLRLSN